MGTSVITRFAEKVDFGPDCWEWTGSLSHGYGHLTRGRRGEGYVLAHRLAWELVTDQPIPSGKKVCHRCDNPRCVRPSHLFLGTQAENLADMRSKGRWRRKSFANNPRGENHPGAKLTLAQVRDIRARFGTISNRALAREFGVSHHTIADIAAGRRWVSSAPR